jgi:large conductance mechanosensitive channel
MKNMINEFKTFVSRGNVMELAVGLILATYFGAIVKSLVNDIIMPPVGYLIAGVDFAELKITVAERMLDDGAVELVTINYGLFLNTILTFLIVAAAIFLVIRAYNNFMKKEEVKPDPKPVEPTKEEKLLTEIRDILNAK